MLKNSLRDECLNGLVRGSMDKVASGADLFGAVPLGSLRSSANVPEGPLQFRVPFDAAFLASFGRLLKLYGESQ